MLSSLTELNNYIDTAQLTEDLGGSLDYCHNRWLTQRTVSFFFNFLFYTLLIDTNWNISDCISKTLGVMNLEVLNCIKRSFWTYNISKCMTDLLFLLWKTGRINEWYKGFKDSEGETNQYFSTGNPQFITVTELEFLLCVMFLSKGIHVFDPILWLFCSSRKAKTVIIKPIVCNGIFCWESEVLWFQAAKKKPPL